MLLGLDIPSVGTDLGAEKLPRDIAEVAAQAGA